LLLTLRGSGRIAFASGSFLVILRLRRRASSTVFELIGICFLDAARFKTPRAYEPKRLIGICFFDAARFINFRIPFRPGIKKAATVSEGRYFVCGFICLKIRAAKSE
jgi:hypothetical protein